MVHIVDLGFVQERTREGGTRLLNVLSHEDFQEGHIPGSLHAPIADPGFDGRLAALLPDKSTPVITYCCSRTCPASTKAARRMEELGYTHVYDYKDGIEGWKAAGLPLDEGTRPPRPPRSAQRERAARLEQGRP